MYFLRRIDSTKWTQLKATITSVSPISYEYASPNNFAEPLPRLGLRVGFLHVESSAAMSVASFLQPLVVCSEYLTHCTAPSSRGLHQCFLKLLQKTEFTLKERAIRVEVAQ